MTSGFGLSRSGFATFCLLLTVLFAKLQWFVPGVDAIIATCLTMAVANLSLWFYDRFLMEDVPEAELKQQLQQQVVKQRVGNVCSQHTHDFAVCPHDSIFAIALINSGDWSALSESINNMTLAERQGFYANLKYSSVSERALQEVINAHPNDVDAHILMGHVKLCFAKRLGLKPGGKLDESMAASVSQAFKHFNLALRARADDPEALCGLLMAKGFTGLRAAHILHSLEKLLAVDPEHMHGVIAAARFLVTSTAQANEFVSVVESTVAGRADATVAIAKILSHIECLSFIENGANNSQVIADVYKQLQRYKGETETPGSYQQRISNNIIAYMLQLIGDNEQSKQYLEKINGLVSPYPWQMNSTP